jgi:hypothetical protein
MQSEPASRPNAVWIVMYYIGSISLEITVEKGEHGSNGKQNGLGQTTPPEQQKITLRRQMDGTGEMPRPQTKH